MSPDTSVSLPDGLFAPHEVVRRLGVRANPLYVLRQAGAGIGGKMVLAVGERFAHCAEPGSAGERLVAEARRIATLASPNLARVREVLVRDGNLVVIGEFVEGEKLQELWRPEKLPLEIALRVIVDVLAGVGALHNLRDAKQQPMKVAHGELSPATIVLGLDGIARVLHAVARCAPDAEPEPGSVGYLSPEVASGDPYDARADVFSAGVLLWEALSEKPLFAGADAQANAGRVRAGGLPPATVPDKAPWAKGLIEVAAKALSAAPDARWPTAAVMAAELRKAAGLKLAPASTVASFARSAFGERARARRESLEAGSAAAPKPALASSPKPPPAVAAAPTPKPAPVVAPAPSPKPAPVAVSAPTPKPARVAATAAIPPPAPPAASPQEPSFLEVDLESAIETVDVVPGIRAQVAEVVELESDHLLEAAPSTFPPAASSAVGGFVQDPFAARGAPGAPPPSPEVPRFAAPLAPVAVAPVRMIGRPPVAEEPPPPSITGAPHFAAAIDPPALLPPPTAPTNYLADPFPAPAMVEPLPVEATALPVAGRRRKLAVLGGVAALGLVIFVLAAVRIAGRDTGVAPATAAPVPPTSSAVATVAPPPPPPTATAAATAPSVAPPPTVPPAVTAAAPPAVTAAPPAAATAPRPTLPAARPAPVVAAAPAHVAPTTPPPAAAKPHPKPAFDPNTL